MGPGQSFPVVLQPRAWVVLGFLREVAGYCDNCGLDNGVGIDTLLAPFLSKESEATLMMREEGIIANQDADVDAGLVNPEVIWGLFGETQGK